VVDGANPTGALVKRFDKIQWEVGPSGGWRADILVDDGALLTILEVKRWASEATRSEVDLDLNNPNNLPAPKGPGYIQKFNNDVGLSVDRNDELNASGWLQPYLDDASGFSCVWADPDEVRHPGNIYYAPVDEAPPDVRLRCAAMAFANIVVIVGLGKVATSLLNWIDPPLQSTNDCVGTYTVTVWRDPERATKLRMDFGDGTSEEVSVPQGDGFAIFSFRHFFDTSQHAPVPPTVGSNASLLSNAAIVEAMVMAGRDPRDEVDISTRHVHVYAQRASIVETGIYADSVTLHPEPPPS